MTETQKATLKGYINTLGHLQELDIMQGECEQNAIETLLTVLTIEYYKDNPLDYFKHKANEDNKPF